MTPTSIGGEQETSLSGG